MARFFAVLKAVRRASQRGSKALQSMRGNNMLYAGLTLAAMMDIPALGFFLGVMVLILFVPSSGDPLTAAPPERLALWPLKTWERRALRLISPLLNPLMWLVLGLMLWNRVTWGLAGLVAGIFAVGFVGSSVLRRPLNVWVPHVPLGRLTHFVKKDLRQFLTSLDVYCALLIALPAAYLRFTGELPAAAHAPLTMALIIMLSTLPLTLFGLDGESGVARYRLLPIAGWQLLAAKSIAYLLLVVVVTAGLSPVGGLAGGLVALAAGHGHSVRCVIPQSRWRFRASKPFGVSLVQMILALLGFGAVTQLGPVWLIACVVLWLVSLWWAGLQLTEG